MGGMPGPGMGGMGGGNQNYRSASFDCVSSSMYSCNNQQFAVTWELPVLVQVLHLLSGRPRFAKTTRRMAGIY